MALGNKIVLTPEPRGRFIEYVVEGALYPGTIVQTKAATERDVGNRLTCQAYNKSGSGAPGLIGVLLEDIQQGKTVLDVYTTLKRGLVYFPLPGDELNCLIGDVSGTSATSDFAIGDRLMVQDGTGLLIDALSGTAAALSAPFEVQETLTDLAANTLCHVMFTGY